MERQTAPIADESSKAAAGQAPRRFRVFLLDRVLLGIFSTLGAGGLGMGAYYDWDWERGRDVQPSAAWCGAILGLMVGLVAAKAWCRLMERWLASFQMPPSIFPFHLGLVCRRAGRKYGVLLGLASAALVHLVLWPLVGLPPGGWEVAALNLVRGLACGVIFGALLGSEFGHGQRATLMKTGGFPV